MKFLLLCLVTMTLSLSLLSLNTGGCSSNIKNAALHVYVENLFSSYDILLLQELETHGLMEMSSCWSLWPYTPLFSSSISRGSGVTTLINTNNLDIISSSIIFPGHILHCKIKSNENIFHIYNVLIPQTDSIALRAINSLLSHLSLSRDDGIIVVGGDFNCTENPALDRLLTPAEHRPRVAAALEDAVGALSLSVTSGADWIPRNRNSPGCGTIHPKSVEFPKPG